MTFLLIPKEISSDRAGVWVATDEAVPTADGRLVYPGGVAPVPAGGWTAWHRAGEPRQLHHQSIEISGLPPRTNGSLAVEFAGVARARARLTTLPVDLPAASERPLTFLLGSCYCREQDKANRVDRAYRGIPPSHRPDFKILCGDQVYLDSPWTRYLRDTHDESEMRSSFLDRYWSTWAGDTRGPGLRELLADGATFFSADDHEFWNNAPSRATLVRDTWGQNGRDRWMRAALSLYRVFQTSRTWTSFDVSPLSFFIAETRINRTADEARFMSDPDFGRLTRWLANLTGPGVLVLGQPIFSEAVGWKGHLADWSLADYSQYDGLVLGLQSTPHSVLVLTGDVHYRRAASSQPLDRFPIHEVISSPLTLVDDKAGGSWHAAPARFPMRSAPGAVPIDVKTDMGFQGHRDHFLIFQCRRVSNSVRIEVFDFGVDPSDAPPGAMRPIAEFRMQ